MLLWAPPALHYTSFLPLSYTHVQATYFLSELLTSAEEALSETHIIRIDWIKDAIRNHTLYVGTRRGRRGVLPTCTYLAHCLLVASWPGLASTTAVFGLAPHAAAVGLHRIPTTPNVTPVLHCRSPTLLCTPFLLYLATPAATRPSWTRTTLPSARWSSTRKPTRSSTTA